MVVKVTTKPRGQLVRANRPREEEVCILALRKETGLQDGGQRAMRERRYGPLTRG